MGRWLAYRWSRPIYWSYGDDDYVDYRDDGVYVDGVETSYGDYYGQAEDLAAAAPKDGDPKAESLEWLPLGVFAYVQEGVPETNAYLQLAVTKEGILGGTYSNQATNVSRPLKGTVDQKTQRAAWTFADGKNTDTVMETGIYNFTKDEVPVLLHFGPDKRHEGKLLRVDEPKEGEEAKPSTPKARPADDEARVWYQLANNYLNAGMKAKAIDYVDRIAAKYPESEWALKAKRLLPERSSHSMRSSLR